MHIRSDSDDLLNVFAINVQPFDTSHFTYVYILNAIVIECVRNLQTFGKVWFSVMRVSSGYIYFHVRPDVWMCICAIRNEYIYIRITLLFGPDRSSLAYN